MKGFVHYIEALAAENTDFRRVIYTAKNCQLVLMALKPKEDIGAEVHKLDQFFRVEAGAGEAVLDGVRTAIRAGFALLVPAGGHVTISSIPAAPRSSSTRSTRRRIIVTAPSTIRARTPRRTVSTSTARRRNSGRSEPTDRGGSRLARHPGRSTDFTPICRVTNACGTVTSEQATLRLCPADLDGRGSVNVNNIDCSFATVEAGC